MKAAGQNELFSRQYFLNNYLMNPAVAGVYDYGDLRLSYNRQWTGVSHSPVSLLLTFHTNVSPYKDQVMRYSYREGRYRPGKKGTQYYGRRLKHGIGFRLIADKVHAFSNTGLTLSYACHVPLSPAWTLSVGLSGGAVISTFNTNGMYIPDQEDPLLQGKRREWIPLMEAGGWLYSPLLYIGASFSKLMDHPYDSSEASDFTNVYATAGCCLPLSGTVNFMPAVLYRMNGFSDNSLDLNFRLLFHEVVWAGMSLRDMKRLSFHAGCELGYWLGIGYTYDLNPEGWGASHEVSIGVRLWGKSRECRNPWYFR